MPDRLSTFVKGTDLRSFVLFSTGVMTSLFMKLLKYTLDRVSFFDWLKMSELFLTPRRKFL
ncbi:hypothetical protein Bpfe_019945 [Biomphalaria pfeifferi]|uniref:Uncharacterized protein n=1 Tax=Biomphalaria pfeifferi TaxID=112525 RepID=A0AAD8B9T3_BIOPF|nr:hypothetical protein Bpfe_019945 [Biomphalaria pfeifferi]